LKKLYSILCSLLLSSTIISCANTNVTPNIQSVSVNSAGTEITLVLEGVNQATETQVVAKLKLRRESLQTNDVSFTILTTGTSSFSDSNSYTLSSFNPALVSGQTYYLIAASGAFNNTGGLTESGQSDEGIYQLFVP
jgi:hypothetical protein